MALKKTTIIATIVFLLFYFSNKSNEIGRPNEKAIDNALEFIVTATMYYPVSSQTDSDPNITADGSKINTNKASELKWIAVSRNLLKRWGGELDYGDVVEISGAGKKDGTYEIHDTMNKRFKNRIDFLETNGTRIYKYENVKIKRVL